MENNAVGKEPYMVFDPPAAPTQETDVPGLRFDFNNGLRVSVPEGDYRVRFIDRDWRSIRPGRKKRSCLPTTTTPKAKRCC